MIKRKANRSRPGERIWKFVVGGWNVAHSHSCLFRTCIDDRRRRAGRVLESQEEAAAAGLAGAGLFVATHRCCGPCSGRHKHSATARRRALCNTRYRAKYHDSAVGDGSRWMSRGNAQRARRANAGFAPHDSLSAGQAVSTDDCLLWRRRRNFCSWPVSEYQARTRAV